MNPIQYTTIYPSPIGPLTLASDGKNITGLWMKDQKYYGSTLGAETQEKMLPVFQDTFRWLDSYFKGENPKMTLPLAPIGSDFRKSVWEILCDIPYGEVITYGHIAKIMAEKLGRPTMSPQAVGGAVGHNPISILIPCHRVVGADGSLTGYAGGIDKKCHLLRLEEVDLQNFFIPQTGTALS
ncbi:MAG: methylated-DNA--[protein]-cysteine S-methyltransferase [Clostridiales bacterium]|nr:methylated-DNA--[protein]-cysteine S-methyltransferase [Clostridiales bacterium]